ncbi:hypothetical protein RHMOL_Rhmol05G0266300 [Rhododendron molle]|uniref:Uncharacterized protein n=2 Tax=Rhododendron molle TaxID=49168 RepID=A0ACC0NT83_RHOML|nr:hypothetical protein RHMOL_Rhmol05G0266300 [Rhododendron molle]
MAATHYVERCMHSSSGIELIVDYGNADSEDIIVSEEEAIARLRIRSIPLDGDDCVHIQEGDHVLSTRKSQSKSLSFDAEVEKVLRVRHSKKVHCRCTFVIRWLHQDLKGTLTVPSSSVMKLAAKSINEHPTVLAFLSMLGKGMGHSNPSPLPPLIADLDFDIYLHELLEKQREIISSLTDMPKKRVAGKLMFCVEVDYEEQNQYTAAPASKLSKSHVQAPPGDNHLKRTTRSAKNLQIGMEAKDPSPPAPSIQEELLKCRPPLNPLAARAAFASLMSKMPQIATSVPLKPETNNDGNSPISTISASGNTQFMVMGASSIRLAKEKGTGSNTSQLPDSRASFACTVSKTKVSQPPKVTRLTRSTIKKGAGIPDGSCHEQKLQPSTGPKRFTCSSVCKAKEPQDVEAKHIMEEHKSGKHSVRDYSEHIIADFAVLERSTLEDEKLATSRNDFLVELLPTHDMNTLRQKEECNKMHEFERNRLRNSTSRSRFTRSAVHVENGIKSMKATQGLEVDMLGRNTKLNSFEGNVAGAKSSVLGTTDWSSSPLEAEGDSPHIEENPNGGKMSSVVKATEKTEGNFTGNGERSRSLKRKGTPSKKELRRSPRLQFLPRTRSQNKS